MLKLGLNHRAELVQYALDKGLLEPPDTRESASSFASQAYVAHPAATTTWHQTADVDRRRQRHRVDGGAARRRLGS